MHAMVLQKANSPLISLQLANPRPGANQVLIEVAACGICRTDLHILDGELAKPKLPLILGHEIVGIVIEKGAGVTNLEIGQRVGVPWLGETCSTCVFCRSGRENLCDAAVFTGYERDGGYATHTVANADYCFPLPQGLSDVNAAPLMCAGLIGWRTLKLAGPAKTIGVYGFGAAAHLVTQVAVYQGRDVYAFTKAGDEDTQKYAIQLGAKWAGASEQMPPTKLDAALIFAPAGELVPRALEAVDKGGTVVCGGIHMSDIPTFPYSLLWQERSLKSVANLTRQDATEFLQIAAAVPVRTDVTVYKLEDANQGLADLRAGSFDGAAVLSIHS